MTPRVPTPLTLTRTALAPYYLVCITTHVFSELLSSIYNHTSIEVGMHPVQSCSSSLIKWGTASFLALLPMVLPSRASLKPTLRPIPGQSTLSLVRHFIFFSQGCNQPRIGTYIGFTLRDGDGALAQSAALTIEAGCRPSLFLTSLLLTWFFSIVFLLDWYVGKSCLVSRVLMLCAGGSSVSGASTSTPAGATATSPS